MIRYQTLGRGGLNTHYSLIIFQGSGQGGTRTRRTSKQSGDGEGDCECVCVSNTQMWFGVVASDATWPDILSRSEQDERRRNREMEGQSARMRAFVKNKKQHGWVEV